MKNKKNVFILFFVILFVGAFFSIYFWDKSEKKRKNDDLELTRRQAIQKFYPEYSVDYEKKACFAGCSVIATTEGKSHYYTYITNGSGVPIAKATCFKVDSMMVVYKIGEFPDSTDSSIGYNKINPKTCEGIK